MKSIILLHGAIGAADQLEQIKKVLSLTFQVFTLDFDGHGKKSDSLEPFSIELFADNLNRFISDNHISNPSVFGYSMGGYVALYYHLHFTSPIEKIFTFATKFNWTPEIASRETKMLDTSAIKLKVPAFAQALEIRHGKEWETVLEKTKKMMLNMGNHPPLSSSDLNRMAIPVQFGLGDSDKMVSLEETIEYKKACKNGSLLVLPNTEHPIEKTNSVDLGFHIQSFFK